MSEMDIGRLLADEELREELMARLTQPDVMQQYGAEALDSDALNKSFKGLQEGLESARDDNLEAIVRAEGRPVWFIKDGSIAEPTTEFWQKRLTAAARGVLEQAVPSVGRVDMRGHPDLPYAGTGWVVTPEIIVTNRHVANVFARTGTKDAKFVFRKNPEGKKIKVSWDAYHEHGTSNEAEYRVREIVHIEDDDEDSPDIAFLRVDQESYDDVALPPPVELAEEDATNDQVIGAVGYAAWDGYRNPGDVMPRIFQNVYNVKRLHPGLVMTVGTNTLNHDCSTLGGNSGSVILDFATGKAVGLHFAGSFMSRNWAVKASVVRERLASQGLLAGDVA